MFMVTLNNYFNFHRYWDVVWSEAGSTGTAGTFERYVIIASHNISLVPILY